MTHRTLPMHTRHTHTNLHTQLSVDCSLVYRERFAVIALRLSAEQLF
jgi:hypothetical protein